MLKISKEAWNRLEQERRRRFIETLANQFADRYPGEAAAWRSTAGRAELNRVISSGEAFGLQSSESLALHALASKVIGVDYADVVLVVGQVLRSTALKEETKVSWLRAWLDAVRLRNTDRKV